MQDRTIVSTYMVGRTYLVLEITQKSYGSVMFCKNIAIVMKNGLLTKELCKLFFQRTRHSLHVKPLMLMY